jgi:NADH dehydrogenase FAD-containing subunit
MTQRALTRSKVVIIGGGGFGGVYAASRSRTNGSAQRSF